MKEIKELQTVFFGTGPLAEYALTTLVEGGLTPLFLVTKPDSIVGRSKEKTPPTIALLAKKFGITVLQPENVSDVVTTLSDKDFDVFIVASYGNIIPDEVLNIPAFGCLNIHPSMLPNYRGSTPIETALLHGEKNFGISIIFLDNKMDHGPILAQRIFDDFITMPDATIETFEKLAGVYGASILLTEVLLPFTRGSLVAEEQDHSLATFTKKFTKETGRVSLSDDIQKIFNVYRACTPWPGCFFLHTHLGHELRVKITNMQHTETGPKILEVRPEGKNTMTFESFKNGYIQ